MASLSAHLRRPDDHGRLPFHPECPLCRGERLAGALPADAILGRRTQGLLAAGVLAFSAAPSAAVAQDPDREQEGAAAPEEVSSGDRGLNPDFDPGGESTDLPFDAPPVPQVEPAPASGDGEEDEALEPEPTTDDAAPIADLGDGSGGSTGDDESEATEPEPEAPAAPEASPSPTPPPPDPTVIETPTAAPVPIETDAAELEEPRSRQRAPGERRRPAATTPEQTERPAPQPEPLRTSSGTSGPTAVPVAQAQPPATSLAPASDRRVAQRGDRLHVVQRGESLWSIARDVLRDGASAAQIAREVNRLWELNRDRIATGDPDLLMVGTRLELR